MPSFEKVEAAMLESNFKITGTEKYTIKPDLQDKFLYCGKLNPELYFDDSIRHGISSFSSLANRAEVSKGLAKLRADIEKGRIDEIVRRYDNDLGDYLYIMGEKAGR